MLTTRSHSLRMWGVPSLAMVRTAVPVPAQLMPTRSGPSSAATATASATCSASVTSHLTNLTPSSLARASPLSALKSMIGDDRAGTVQTTHGRLAEARGPAGHDRCCTLGIHGGAD